WSDPIGFGIVPVAVANLPDGRLITWSSQFRDTYVATGDGATFTEIFDPFLGSDGQALGEFVTNTDHDMFCPGINNLADGRILSAGGTSSERTSIYDPTTGLWSVAAEMNIPRGYQGNVTLSDGTVFTLGGSWGGGNNSSTNGGKDAELWSPETGWLLLPGITGEDIYNSNDLSRETEGVFRVDNHLWLWPASNGRVFHAGPSEMMHWIDVNGAGSIEDVGLRSNDTYSMKGTTVMFDVDRILKVGGAESYGSDNPAKDNSFVIDFSNENNVTVTPTVNNLFFSRTMHNSTVLPNGEILVTGGLDHAEVFTDDGSRLTAEIYSPSSNSWRQVAGMQIPRTYHSVAILMVDGRVFVGGGGLCDDSNPDECVNHFDAEVYSPPYLFNGDGSLATRPTISAPDTADYNTSINVTGSTGIQEFSLIRFSAATHSTNNEQRRIPVSFSGNGNYSVNIPERNLLPPGYYMLFALDSNGVPSVAETIQIGSAIPLPENPTLVLDLNFDDGSGSTVSDASSYSNDATIFDVDDAGATKIPSTDNWGTGLFGGALETDGFEFESNTIVDVPYSASMATVENAITIMAWVSRDEIVNNASIFTHDYPALFFGFHNSLYKWEIYTPGGNAGASCLASYTPEDTWVHIAATFDGETAKLFANGIEICSKPYSGSFNLNPSEPNFSSFTASGFYERRTNP
uniref:galactose oxidase-like domain-containing protein n=1 Tax=Eudoraea chungangensis TaxID=1481905 RepID=UPI0023ED98A5